MRVHSYFEHKLLVIFFVILIGILTLAAKTYQNNQIHDNTTWWVEHTKDALEVAADISNHENDLESSLRAYIITGDSTFLASFINAQKTLLELISQLDVLMQHDPAQRARIESLKSLATEKIHAAEHSIALRNTEGTKAAQFFFTSKTGNNHSRRIDSLLNRIQVEEGYLLKVRTQANAESSRNFIQFYFGLIALLILILTTFFMALWRNLKSRKKAELALLESRELLQSIIDNTTSLIFIKDLNGRFTLVNKQFEKIHGLQSGEAIGKTVFDVLSSHYALQHAQHDQRVIREGQLLEVQEDAELNGKPNHFYSIKFPLRTQKGTIYAVGGISTNITEVITRQQLEKQKEIAETTMEAQEKERSLLSRELHDNVNQLLTHAKLCLEVATTNADLQEPFLDKCKQAIQKAISEIRNLSHNLSAPSFVDNRLTEAVRDLATDIQVSRPIKTHLHFIEEEEINHLPAKVKLTLYRIIQEQVNNILKYAQAHTISFELKLRNNKDIYLSIADDGVGFDTYTKSKGIGLRNIQSRSEFYSGVMRITSSPNHGCTIEVEIPRTGYANT